MAYTQGNDINILQGADNASVGAGAGNDRYILDSSVLNANQQISISDTQGINTLQLVGGLVITSALVASDAFLVTLNNGAVITVLGASSFNFQTGGNPINGSGGLVQNYSAFVTTSLGVASGVPTVNSAPVAVGMKTISAAGGVGGGLNTILVTAAGVVGTPAADNFVFDVAPAVADVNGSNFQSTITGFSTTGTAIDKLTIDLPNANAAITTLAQLNGQQGVTVQVNPFSSSALINFGPDANGGQLVTLTLTGIIDVTAVTVSII